MTPLTTRVEGAGPDEQREFSEADIAEMQRLARESGWPDELYFGLCAAILRAGDAE